MHGIYRLPAIFEGADKSCESTADHLKSLAMRCSFGLFRASRGKILERDAAESHSPRSDTLDTVPPLIMRGR